MEISVKKEKIFVKGEKFNHTIWYHIVSTSKFLENHFKIYFRLIGHPNLLSSSVTTDDQMLTELSAVHFDQQQAGRK